MTVVSGKLGAMHGGLVGGDANAGKPSADGGGGNVSKMYLR